jgi:DNA polymerase-1
MPDADLYGRGAFVKTVAFDTETLGLEWFDGQTAFLLSWTDDAGSHVADVKDPDGVAAFRRAIDAADRLVAHNLNFDVHQVRETLGIDLLDAGKELVDTDQLARVVLPERRFGSDNAGGYKLKDLAATYLRNTAKDAEDTILELGRSIGVKLKGENATPGGYYDVWRAYPEQMEFYALLDAEYARDLLPILERKVKGLERPWQVEREVQPHIIRAEQRGVRVDQAKVIPLKADYEIRQAEAFEKVTAELGEDALEGNDSLRESLLSAGIPLYRMTETGQLATHKAALAEFEADYPVLKALSDWRTASKFLATYINPMVGRDVVHTSFWQQGAWTSRMSCSRPNMQNIPVRSGTEVREVFIPREDHCFIVCDYDSIELRLLAYYLNDPGFQEKIERGDDVFAELASILPLATHGPDPACTARGMPGQDVRTQAKNTTYAITYGAGGGKIGDMLGLDPAPYYGADHPAILKARAAGRMWPREGWQHAEARKVIRTVKSWLPGYNHLNQRIRKKVETVGYVETIMRRKQPVNKDKSYVGLNALIQGSAAEIMKQGIINVAAAVKHLDAVPVLFVHDEVVLECPTVHAQECLRLTQDAMTAAWDLNPSLGVSGSICFNNYGEGK